MIKNQCFSKHKFILLGQFVTKPFVFLSLDVEYFSGANVLNEIFRNILLKTMRCRFYPRPGTLIFGYPTDSISYKIYLL